MRTTKQQRIYIELTRDKMGAVASSHIAAEIRYRLQSQETVRIIFAAAPSQSEMLHALAREQGVEWTRVEAFHMDEYIGLPDSAPQNFRLWLQREFFSRVPLGKIVLIEPGRDPQGCAFEYAKQLAANPIDIVCLGIGMNGHLAFNDPPADFNDSLDVKIVTLANASRQQQVEDGLFTSLEEVPTHAVSLTIPRLLRADRLFCCVPGRLKQNAVTRALTGSVDPSSPASILREHAGCTIYLDTESAAGLNSENLSRKDL
jgi:glucosamine-6-phosphate deaminase